jgi:hypothetical protein
LGTHVCRLFLHNGARLSSGDGQEPNGARQHLLRGAAAAGSDLAGDLQYSHGRLPMINGETTGWKWDYTFHKWGYKYL